jgi:hypothetical protein
LFLLVASDTTTRRAGLVPRKTVELIIERKPWTPPSHRFKDDTPVPVRIDFGDTDLQEKAKAAQGQWDSKERIAYPVRENQGRRLEKFIIT